MAARPTTEDDGRRRAVSRRMRSAPVESGLGMVPVPSDDGRIVLRAPLDDRARDADGRVSPLLVALIADSGIGFLIFTAARLAAGAPTVDLRIDQVGPVAPEATAVTGELSLLHLDDDIGVGRAELRDDTGRLVAHAVATMALTGVPDRPGGLASSTARDGTDGSAAAGPVGNGSPANGSPANGSAGNGSAANGSASAGSAAGDRDGTGSGPDPEAADFRAHVLPFDPQRLHPDRLETAPGPGGDAAPDVLFTPGPSAMNLNGTTHGAVLAGLAQAAQGVFLTGRGSAPRPLSVTVDYLRPVQVDATVRARTEQVRDGRRFWTVRTELLLPDGRPAVRATGNGIWPR